MNYDCDLIIGNGRLARHLRHLYMSGGIAFNHWVRAEQDQSSLFLLLKSARTVLLCVSDDSIVERAAAVKQYTDAPIFHFSGSLYEPGLIGLHPLAAFGAELYSPEFYTQLSWTIDSEAPLLPYFLTQKPLSIKPHQKAYYHALLSLNSNLPQLLALMTQQKFEEWGWPKEALNVLVQSTATLIQQKDFHTPTGPQFRGDLKTVERHFTALQNTELLDVYRSFVELAESYKMQKNEEHKGKL